MLKRIIGLITCLLLLAVLTALPIAAQETGGEPDTKEETDSETVEGGSSFAEATADFLLAHAEKLLSAGSLLLGGVLAFLFRRGLLPALSGGFTRISREVGEFGKITEGAAEELRALAVPLGELCKETETRLADAGRRIETLERELRLAKSEQEASRLLSEAALSMMKEVFTGAKLPAASKLALEELYADTKRKLALCTDRRGMVTDETAE